MAEVTLKQVEKYYDETKVIHGLDLAIRDGEFVVLVGPSGCGKSTLLRMIAGLEPISRGEIHIGARKVNDIAPKDRDVAMVFQNYALYPHKTVYDNMAFGLKLRKVDKAVIAERVNKAATILGLNDYLKRYPRHLSGGQRQRVAMGRAIVRDPQVFLFDEPLSNLDAQLRVSMRGEIKALHADLGTTAVYVTHDQVEAMTMADRIVVLNQGRVEQIGAPLALYDHPANLFVARFIGSPAMNILEGILRRDGAETWFERPDGAVLPLPADVAAGDGAKVSYGIRPEHLALSNADDGIPARVEVIEPTGLATLVFATLSGAPVCALTNERVNLARGDTVHFAPRLGAVHLFDGTSGKRL
ncbi:MAG: sn-glycerol-3-phosphate ABC transporter ATP-binding protein UgpC [Gammaproteobacteria bacterium]